MDGFVGFALRYAARSLARNRRRTVLTIGTVALSAMVSVIATRYSTAVMKIWADGAIDHGAGHAQYHINGYFDHPDIIAERLTFKAGHPLEAELAADPAVLAYSRRLNFEGIITHGAKSIYFLGKAVSAADELKVSPEIFHADTDRGQFVSSAVPNGIAVGKGLAETLNLKIGDEATVMAHTLAGAVNGTDVVIVGILDPPLPSLSKRLVYLPIEQGQKSIKVPDRYTELAVRLKPGTKAEKWVAEHLASAATEGLDLRGWWQVDPIIRKVEKIWDSVVGVISFLLFVSAGISVLNIVFMLVAERTTEIGTLMALGARPRDIRTLFTLEASLIGGIGGSLGVAAGSAALKVMDLLGVPFESPFNGGTLMVHPHPSLLTAAFVAGAAVLICYISALAPARKGARVEPVVAFRGQIT